MAKNNIIRDFYSSEYDQILTDSKGVVFGKSYTVYEIYKQSNVSNLEKINGYIVNVKQRIVVPNNSFTPGASKTTSYLNYPAILQNTITLNLSKNAQAKVLSYSPKTLDVGVYSDTVTTENSTVTRNNQINTGSNTSNVNNYVVALDGGFYNDIPIGNVSLNYSQGWNSEHLRDYSNGKSSRLQGNSSSGFSMSVKDWNVIGSFDPSQNMMRWVWGQAFPWNTLLYNQLNPDGVTIACPSFVVNRLVDGSLLLPPSELAMFGLDFTSRATWLIEYPNNVAVNTDEIITVTHQTKRYTASHAMQSGTLILSLDSDDSASAMTYNSPSINLSLYSLAPLDVGSTVVNFYTDEFTLAPQNPTDQFLISSRDNDIVISGVGFDANMSSSLSDNTTSIQVQFKIADSYKDYSIGLNHVIQLADQSQVASLNISLIVTIGTVEKIFTINSIGPSQLVIPLRSIFDNTSLDAQDFLSVGLNAVTISINNTGTTPVTYSLKSILVG